MRCDCCPLSDPEDVCPEAEGKYGLEHKDGVLGCTHPRSWVKKRDDMHTKAIGCAGGGKMKYDEAQAIIYGCTTALRMGHELNKDQWIEYAEALRIVLQLAEQETI